jgi:hypothetical protein
MYPFIEYQGRTMTKQEIGILGGYIRQLANALALRDWQFTISDKPCDEDAVASILATAGRKRAQIRLAWNFRDLDPEEQRHTIVHELLHCHFASVNDLICIDLSRVSFLSDHEHDGIFLPFKRLMEYGIDGVADGVSDLFPLIDWGVETEP